jgi:hypothetical protein
MKNEAKFMRLNFRPQKKNDGKDRETFLSSPERPVKTLSAGFLA